MGNPMDVFFNLGDKVTKGDPIRKAKFDYSLLWVMFFAFFTVLLGNAINFYKTMQIHYLGWSFVMLAIMWFQYSGLKQARQMYKTLKEFSNPAPKKEDSSGKKEKIKDESAEEMLGGFQ